MSQKEDKIEPSCVSFEILQFACLRVADVSYRIEDVSISVNVEKTADKKEKTLGAICELSVFAAPQGEKEVGDFTNSTTDPDDGVEVGFMSTHIRFFVAGLSQITSSDGEIRVPAPLAVDMIGQAYDGLRGAWAAKSSGTHLGHIVLPSQDRRDLASRVFDFKILPEEVTVLDEGSESEDGGDSSET